MQLLSTLLGPVKPPVATQADVTSAGGIYHLIDENGTLTATPASPDQPPAHIILSERCLICLCDYERSEEIRQLSVCKHVYHRECIDEVSWLLLPKLFLDQLANTSEVVDNRSQLLPTLPGTRCCRRLRHTNSATRSFNNDDLIFRIRVDFVHDMFYESSSHAKNAGYSNWDRWAVLCACSGVDLVMTVFLMRLLGRGPVRHVDGENPS